MALYFFPLRKRLRFVLLGFGILAGWLMGLYQMARGEHFLTHTLTTFFISWALILLLARVLKLRNQL